MRWPDGYNTPEEYPQANFQIADGGYGAMHEYGHYLQSQQTGPLYLFKYALPSSFNPTWTEPDASTLASNYFHNIDEDFTWEETTDLYRTLGKTKNAKWYEYLFPFLVR